MKSFKKLKIHQLLLVLVVILNIIGLKLASNLHAQVNCSEINAPSFLPLYLLTGVSFIAACVAVIVSLKAGRKSDKVTSIIILIAQYPIYFLMFIQATFNLC